MKNVSILFLVFNRPGTTKKVFEAIRQAQPSKLYVAADGARSDIVGEEKKVQEVRCIATNVDWDCEVKTLFRDQNLGCKMAVSSAITWFFEHEEEGIILEDDCLPDQTFFPYCEELLERYRNDTRIMAISGDNFQQGKKRTEYSYYFSRYNHVWGWASWRRAWKFYDKELLSWPEIKSYGLLNDIAGGNEALANYWGNIFDTCYTGQIDTWDYQWMFSCWIQSGLTILPNVNLISNIGFDVHATHTKKQDDKHACMPVEMIECPLAHPPFVIRGAIADAFTDRNTFGIKQPQPSLIYRLIDQVRKCF
ncbi:Hemolytic protein HlpA-like protein [Candidatus Electrothrix laxa]